MIQETITYHCRKCGSPNSVYPALWEVVAETAQAANAQVFATTHSYECIQAAVEVFAKPDPN